MAVSTIDPNGLNIGQIGGTRNKIINGNFDVWQRGTSGSSGYIADRWTTVLSGSTAAISQQAFTLGQTDVPNEPKYFHRVVVTSVAGAGSNAIVLQRIEGVRNLAGQTATLSFWAKADAAKNIAVEFVQVFGDGGSPSTAVLAIGVTTISLTTAWQKFTATVSFPSISGKTLGTEGDDFISMNFWLDAGSDYNDRTNSLGQQSGTFDIAQVQLEAGDTATPFEHRSFGQELALCQRYYYKIFPGATSAVFGPAYSFSTTGAQAAIPYPVTMRTAPTALEQSGTANHYAVVAGSSVVTCSAVPTYGASTTNYSAIVNATVSSGLTDGYGGVLRTDATNGANAYLSWSAEL
jgi:hypothetical protein